MVVLGPTASGKSDLALRIAQGCAGEIVNFDSVQVYRGFDIGSAKLPASERQGVPHHLIDVIEPDQLFTAGEFARTARAVVSAIAARGRIPVMVGGTGFYLRAFLAGLPPGPARNEALRARLAERESRRSGSLHRLLGRLDPAAAPRIHRNDTRKLIRALELCIMRRQPASDLQASHKEPLTGFRVTQIGLDPPRPALFERIDRRVFGMFERGLIPEMQSMLARGVPKTAKPFESLGYAQALAYLEGDISLTEAIRLTQLRTRQYAKRQMTWFRREPEVHWFQCFGADVAAAEIKLN